MMHFHSTLIIAPMQYFTLPDQFQVDSLGVLVLGIPRESTWNGRNE